MLKLFSIAEIVLLTTAIFVINGNKSAFAADCTKTKSVNVPWSWSLTQNGSSFASIYVDTVSVGSFEKLTGSDSFNVSYTAKLNFNPPTDYCTKRNDPSEDNNLALKGFFTGNLATRFVPILGFPVVGGPFAGASASITTLPPFKEETIIIGTTIIDQQRPGSIAVKSGKTTMMFSGYLDGFAANGIKNLPDSRSFAVAQLSLSANLLEPTSGVATYTVPEPVPEPLTILGSVAALGFGAYAERKRKPSNSSEKDDTKDS